MQATPNIGTPQYESQMLTRMKGGINNNTIIVGDFNISLTPMDSSTKQKINKETQTLFFFSFLFYLFIFFSGFCHTLT